MDEDRKRKYDIIITNLDGFNKEQLDAIYETVIKIKSLTGVRRDRARTGRADAGEIADVILNLLSLPHAVVAKILQYLTAPELSVVSLVSKEMKKIIAEYHLFERKKHILSFGWGVFGRLGDGKTDEHYVGTPTLVQGIKNVIQVSCGKFHTAVITSDGVLYTFGSGKYGTLGDGRTDDHSVGTPTLVQGIENAIQVSCGSSHTAVITSDGYLYTFGWGQYGVLGDGRTNFHSVGTPTLVQGIKNAIQVSCGAYHTAVITSDGFLYTFGHGRYGVLGNGRNDDHSVGTPTLVPGIINAIQVSCGVNHTAIITSDGSLYTFGPGMFGRLGDGRTNFHSVGTPTLVQGIENAIQVSCGDDHTAVITSDGSLYTFGGGYLGRLGNGRTDDHSVGTPTLVPGIENAIQVSCGKFHTAVITSDGSLYTFGYELLGRLGNGRNDDDSVGMPTLIRNIPKIVNISCGSEHTVIVTGIPKDDKILTIASRIPICAECSFATAYKCDSCQVELCASCFTNIHIK
jgi:alpha-tubulin suppressor-like RCC1 family protein